MRNRKIALITGITGFAGSHMAELLLSQGFEVYGLCRWRSRTENIEHIRSKLNLIEGDLLDAHSLQNLMMNVRPSHIFHLAAQSFVPASWISPAVTLEINVIGSCNLFEAVRVAQLDPVIQIACSSEEYGLVKPSEVPIKETNPLRPLSPYGVSKVAMDYLGYQYFKSYNMRIVRTRGFNHTGPRRGEIFAESSFAKQIVEIEKGMRESVIMVGNLEAQRDYSDVRDMVKGYLMAVEKGEPGEVYNICSSKARKINEVLQTLMSFSKVKVEIRQDPARMRPSDVPILLGDNTKFRRRTGWKNTVAFEQTMEDLLNYWREKI